MQFCTPREGNPGNVLLTCWNLLKYSYQCIWSRVFLLGYTLILYIFLQLLLRMAANMSSALHLAGSQKRYGELIAQALQREYLITYNVQPSLRQTSVIRHM